MIKLERLPVSRQFLKEYALNAERSWKSSGGGPHLRHFKGHSLEYREHAPYIPGDDIRHIDWMASGRSREWLVRRFEAEEHFQMVISIDHRDSMEFPLPPTVSKLQAAAWIAEAIGRIALNSGDSMRLHALFGRASRASAQQRMGTLAAGRIQSEMQRMITQSPEPAVDSAGIEAILPPAAVWVILTDLYFSEEQAAQLARRIDAALQGWRTVALIELDSWPLEMAVLGTGPRRIQGPGAPAGPGEYQIDDDALAQVEKNIQANRESFYRRIGRAGLLFSRWSWPAEGVLEAADFFKARFKTDRTLQSLLWRPA